MNLQLERLRKEAGYKSRREMAENSEFNERQIKAWECGERNLKLSDACLLADFFHCTLDELAGRDFHQAEYSDPRQQVLNHCYGQLNDKSKSELAGLASTFTADPSRLAAKSGQGAEHVVAEEGVA